MRRGLVFGNGAPRELSSHSFWGFVQAYLNGMGGFEGTSGVFKKPFALLLFKSEMERVVCKWALGDGEGAF